MAALVDKYGAERIIVNSAADWGISDPLKVPKTAQLMQERGASEETLRTIFWDNPVAFFAQSGRLSVEDFGAAAVVDQRALWEGNSVLRGQQPVVAEV